MTTTHSVSSKHLLDECRCEICRKDQRSTIKHFNGEGKSLLLDPDSLRSVSLISDSLRSILLVWIRITEYHHNTEILW